MNWIQNKLGNYFNKNVFRTLFILWFLLFPFDANVLPVSIGFMTIYPYLLLTFFLLVYSFLSNPMEQPKKSDKFVIGFFFAWAIYGVISFMFVNEKAYAYYEIRSLILMSVTVWLLFRVKYLLGAKSFFEILHRLSIFLFITLTVFAFFEFFTGIHFSGQYTEKLWNLPVEMFTYAPVFLYDNPNNFMSYFFGLAIIIFLSDFRLNDKPLKILLIILTLFFFSVVADSTFGKIAVFLLFLSLTINNITHITVTYKKNFMWIAIVGLSVIYCVVTKPLYYGPIWKNGKHYIIHSFTPVEIKENKLRFYSPDTLVNLFGENELIEQYDKYQLKSTTYSSTIRKNLLINGFILLKKSNYLGVGPGQFSWYHEQKLVPTKNTLAVTNPHDGLMEILSQYGLPIFIPYIFIFIFYWFKAFRNRRNNLDYFIFMTTCYLSFFIISDMPSAFLNLNIGWILIPILLISSSQLLKKSNG